MNQEQDNTLIVPTFSEQEDESYIARAQEVAKYVINAFLSNQIRRERIGENKRKEFAAIWMPICVDALRRGEPQVKQQLQSGLEIDEGEKVRLYRVDEDGIIGWKLAPKSQDIFAQSKFLRDLRESGQPIEGGSEFWTDHYLVEEALSAGLREQAKIYADFSQAVSLIIRTQQQCNRTLELLKSPSDLGYFQDVIRMYNSLGEADSEDERKLKFTANFLAPQDDVVDSFPKAVELSQNIFRLNDLFQSDGQPVIDVHKSRYEDSLAVELLTNPNATVNPTWLRTPKTTVEYVFATNLFINQLMNETPKEDFSSRLFMVVSSVVEEQREKLENTFTLLGIDSKLGIEYVTNLMNNCLLDLPGKDLIGPNDTVRILRSNPELNNMYLFDVNIPRRMVAKPRVESRLPSTADFMNNIIKNGQLSAQMLFRMRNMTETQQQEVLPMLLDPQRYADEEKYMDAISRIMTALGIVFSPEDRLFTSSPIRISASAGFFLGRVRQKVIEGDISVINAVEAIIVKKFFNKFLEERVITVQDWRNLRTLISTNGRRAFDEGADYLNYAINRIQNTTVGAVLFGFDPLKDYAVLRKKIQSALMMYEDEIRNKRRYLTFGRKMSAAEGALLNEFSARLHSINLSDLVYNTLGQIKEDYFGEGYQKDRAAFIARILENSIA